MKQLLVNAFEQFVPSPQELWQRGDASIENIEIEPGHFEEVPFFNLEISKIKLSRIDDLKLSRLGRARRIGREIIAQVELSDGIERLVRLIKLDDSYRSGADFTVTDGTAWTTTINGYTHDRARRIARQAGVEVVQIGAEHSGSVIPFGFDGLRLAQTIHDARTISLAKAAQAEQLIISQLTKDYDLSADQYVIGDSRSSMKTPGQFPYADFYGNQIIHMDTKAPCVPEKLAAGDASRFIHWLGKEALGGSGVVLKLASEGKLPTLVGTVSANPNFIISSLLGAAPALASGEAGQLVNWVPRYAHGHIVVYGNDGLSLGDKWHEAWQDHPNVHVKTVPGKTHANLLDSRAHREQIDRINRFSQQLVLRSGDLSQIDWRQVYKG